MWGRAGCWGLLAHGNMGMGFQPTLCHPALVCVGSALVVLVGELWAQGALAGPTCMPVVLVQERGQHGGVLQTCSTSCQSTTAAQHGQPEGCPTLLGHSSVARHREHQLGHEEPLAHLSPPCRVWVGFSLPCSWGQHWGY